MSEISAQGSNRILTLHFFPSFPDAIARQVANNTGLRELISERHLGSADPGGGSLLICECL